jgi:hypothetical protein
MRGLESGNNQFSGQFRTYERPRETGIVRDQDPLETRNHAISKEKFGVMKDL